MEIIGVDKEFDEFICKVLVEVLIKENFKGIKFDFEFFIKFFSYFKNDKIKKNVDKIVVFFKKYFGVKGYD